MGSPLPTLLEILAAARRAGEPFDAAWAAATTTALGANCDPGDWAPVLDATVDAWRAGYHRMAPSPPEGALSLVGEDRDARGGNPCRHCGDEIPAGKRRTALYCRDECRRAASAERLAAA